MDDKRKYDIRAKLDVDSDAPWFGSQNAEMPSKMEKEISKNLSQSITNSYSGTNKVLKVIVRSVAAACLISFILFAHEQFYSIRKLSHLEQRIAECHGTYIQAQKSQNDLLIINSFFSWTDIKDFTTNDFETTYKELVPVWLQNNLIGDEQIKIRIQQYLQEYQIATKIHLP